MISHKRLFQSICVILVLTSCITPPANGIGEMAYYKSNIYLCGYHVRRLDLSDNSTKDFPIQCEQILVTNQGQVWIIAPPNQVKTFDGKRWIDIDIPQEGYITHLSETSDGLVWFSSSLLSYYDSRTGQASTVVSATLIIPATPAPKAGELVVTLPSKGRIGAVFEAADNTIWYNQQLDGLIQWNRTTGQKKIWKPDDGFQGSAPIPAKFIQTHNGDMWVGTDTGVYRLRNNDWQTWTFPGEDSGGMRKKSMGDFVVTDMIEDHNRNVWVAFQRAGVAMWNGSEWKSVGDFESPAGPIALYEDKEGKVWIGSRQQDVTSSKGGVLKKYEGIRLTSFIEMPDHRLFGGGSEGLFLYDSQSDQWKPYPPDK
jgi:hypothetical protein